MSTEPGPEIYEDDQWTDEPPPKKRGIKPIWGVAAVIGALFVGCISGVGMAGTSTEDESPPATVAADDGRVEELEGQIEALTAERDETQSSLESANAERDEAVASLDAAPEDTGADERVGELEAETQRLESQLAELQEQNDTQAGTIEELQTAAEQAATAELGLSPEDAGTERAAFAQGFEAGRIQLADAIESDVFELDSVDQFLFDAPTDTINLSATSPFSGAEYSEDAAWSIYRVMGGLYEERDGYLPALNVTVTGGEGSSTYSCSGEFMKRLADRAVDRAAWSAEC